MRDRSSKGSTPSVRRRRPRDQRPSPQPDLVVRDHAPRSAFRQFDIVFPLVYALLYGAVAIAVQRMLFPIGDWGVETDFYSDLVRAAQALMRGDVSTAHYPFKGPVYSICLAAIHRVFGAVFDGDWYRSAVLLNALSVTVVLQVIYHLTRLAFPRPVAALTMVAVSLMFEFFAHAHKATSDLLFVVFAHLAILALLGTSRSGSHSRVMIAGVFSGLAFLTRYNGIFLPVASLIVILGIDPHRARTPAARFRAAVLYLLMFLCISAPWFAINARETGSILATKNVFNIVLEFRGRETANALSSTGVGALWQVLSEDPLGVAAHYVTNIGRHLLMDIRSVLGPLAGALLVLGLLRFTLVPPTRLEASLLIFGVTHHLVMAFLFYLPRFAFPILPIYYSIAFSSLFGRRVESQPLIHRGAPGPVATVTRWLHQWFAAIDDSGWAGEPEGRVSRPERGAAARSTIQPHRRVVIRALAVALVAGVLVHELAAVIANEQGYLENRPLSVLPAAAFLRQDAAHTHRSVIMARKPHVAYYADLEHQPYPPLIATMTEIAAAAHDGKVDYIFYGPVERYHFQDRQFLAHLERQSGIEIVYDTPDTRIYATTEEFGKGEPWTAAVGTQLLERLRTANPLDTRAVFVANRNLGIYHKMRGEWSEAASYLDAAIRTAERSAGDVSPREVSLLICSLSHAYLFLGRHEEGITLLSEHLPDFEQDGDERAMANAHIVLGRHHEQLQDVDSALRHFRAARELCLALGDHDQAVAMEQAIKKLAPP